MENNLNAKTIGQNQAVKSKFLITIPIIPVIREVFTEYKEESLTMNVFGCSIPGMNTPPVVLKSHGMQIKQNGNETTFDDFEFSFLTLSVPKFLFLTEAFSGKGAVSFVNFTNELAALSIIAGLFLVAFSRERVEDEMIGRMRLEALQWSVVANYVILAVLILVSHGFGFFYILAHNMFTVLLVFIVRMRWLMYRNSHQTLVS